MANVVIFSDAGYQRSLGPHRIASEVRKYGFTCQVISFIRYFEKDDLYRLCEKFIGNDTKIVGFSTTFFFDNQKTDMSDPLFFALRILIEHIRKTRPSIKIVFGGPNGKKLRRHSFYADVIIMGYGETGIIKLLRDEKMAAVEYVDDTPVYNDNNEGFDICTSTVIYDQTDAILDDEFLVLEVSRGCIFRCKFCAYPLNGKKKLDYLKDPEILRQELIRNYELFKINKYMISDDTFNDTTEKLRILHSVFTSLPFKIYFSCYLRLDLLNAHREQINLLLEMGLVGCQFGIETFHPKAASVIGKGAVGPAAKELLNDLKTKYWKNRVKVQVSLICGLPFETLESYEETIQWILDPNNLVERIQPQPLYLPNPKFNDFSWASEFQLNAAKYGFYWTSSSQTQWKNLNGPITSFDEAKMMSVKMNEAVKNSSRDFRGGWAILNSYPFTKFFRNKKTFEEIIEMDRLEYGSWMDAEISRGWRLFFQTYKEKLFSLPN